MSDPIISLCITYPHKNDLSRKVIFRIADVINDCLVQAEYTNLTDEENNGLNYPKNIGFKPNEAVMNRAEIRKWWFNDPNAKLPLSTSFPLPFYEVVFSKEFSGIGLTEEDVIRKIFKNGFELFDGVSQNILIVIGEDGDYYIALESRKNDFDISKNHYRINPNINDMSHVPHYFNKRYIHKDDLIGTEGVGIYIGEGLKAQNRYFYKYLTLEETDEKFYLRDFAEYIPVFINKYIKQQNEIIDLTNNKVRKFVSIIENVLNKQSDLIEFFKIAGYRPEIVIKEMPNYSQQIVNAFLANDGISKIVEMYVYNSKEFYNQCLETVKEKWLKDKDAERDKLLSEIDKKQIQLQSLSKVIEDKENIQKTLEKNIVDSNERVQLLNKKQENIQTQIITELKDFDEKLVQYIANNAFYKSFGKDESEAKVASLSQKVLISRGEAFEYNGELETIDSTTDFIEDLSENLQIVGICPDYAYDLSQTVFTSICLHMGIMALGYYARKFANAVSALVDGKRCGVLTLPVGYRDLNELSNYVQNSSSKVILIENALDNITETLCISVIKQCQDKILIFSIEDEENISMLSKSIWNYILLVNIDSLFEFPKDGELLLGKAEQNIFDCHDIQTSLPSELKKLVPLLRYLKLSKATGIRLAQMECIINEVTDDRLINTIILLEIVNLSKSLGKIDELIELGKDVISDRQEKLIRSTIQEDEPNE